MELADATQLHPLYLSWDQFNPEVRNLCNNWPMHGQVDEEHPEPAGFPAAVARNLGEGRVVHICTDIFGQYRTYGDPQMLCWLREIVDFLQPEPLFRTNAPSWVDASLRRKGHAMLVHLVNQNPGRDVAKLHTDDTWVDEIPEIGPFTCEVRRERKPARVTWEPGSKALKHEFSRGVVRITIPPFRIHGCIVIQ